MGLGNLILENRLPGLDLFLRKVTTGVSSSPTSLITFCSHHRIEFTRSRPYHKNDQAWVEQKNGSVVRRSVGYGRLEGIAAAEALGRLYSASRLFVNFFQPSFKLAETHRVGAHVRKRYFAPETPCARLLASDHIDGPMKDRLRAVLATLDPLRLLDENPDRPASPRRPGRWRAGPRAAASRCGFRRLPEESRPRLAGR